MVQNPEHHDTTEATRYFLLNLEHTNVCSAKLLSNGTLKIVQRPTLHGDACPSVRQSYAFDFWVALVCLGHPPAGGGLASQGGHDQSVIDMFNLSNLRWLQGGRPSQSRLVNDLLGAEQNHWKRFAHAWSFCSAMAVRSRKMMDIAQSILTGWILDKLTRNHEWLCPGWAESPSP